MRLGSTPKTTPSKTNIAGKWVSDITNSSGIPRRSSSFYTPDTAFSSRRTARWLPTSTSCSRPRTTARNRLWGELRRYRQQKFPALSAASAGVLGIKPLNLGQCFALDALLDENINLVTLLGKAGTGKTLLAVAAGLFQVVQKDVYHRVIVSRPTMPMGRDIGYIPGDIHEKMRPWMQPIFDAIELIREIDRRSRPRSLPPDILESDEIGVEPLTYIRGRSIPHQFMIIDEAQNLTPHEVKTIITRVGRGTKVVLTGDLHQIDNPYVDAYSNGFSCVIDRFGDEKISAHITLTKGERSELAEIAANLL